MSSGVQSPPWRRASRDEILAYYQREFGSYTKQIPPWLTPKSTAEFGISLSQRYPAKSSHSGVDYNYQLKDFIRRSTTQSGEYPHFDSWADARKMFVDPVQHDPLRAVASSGGQLLESDKLGEVDTDVPDETPVAEAVYFSLTTNADKWILAFDIDAKDIAKNRVFGDRQETSTPSETTPDTIAETVVPSEPPQGYNYSHSDVQTCLDYAAELEKFVSDELGFSTTMKQYSGQGAHVFGVPQDGDPYHDYPKTARETLTNYVSDKLAVPIDRVVTPDAARVMRLPYSLHAGVGRVVTPFEDPEDFDPRIDAIPEVLKEDSNGGINE